MNLLQTQDSLKNLSDQQLMTEMQNPTGQVPQFLVLSELKRRKDMRNQNQSPPSRTVAEELTEPSQAAITQPGTVPAQAMPQGAQGAGIRTLGAPGMREGGVVRMAAGERVPSPTGLDGYTDPAQPPGTTAAAPATTEGAFPFARVEPSMSLVGLDQIAQRPGPAQAPPPAQFMANRPAGPMVATQAIGQPLQADNQSTLPPPTIIDRSAMNAIAQRMERERVDPNKAREEARNMALLQAGLAIAGGTSPHFAQNLAGAIPAIQGYQTQIANIRREGRDELKAQFDLAKADVEAQYQQGTLTYHERSIAMERINNQERNATTLQAHRESAGASIEAARIAAGGRDRLTDMDKTVADILKDNPDMKPSEARRQAADMLRGFTARGEAALDTQNQRDIGAALRNPELRTSMGNTIRRQLGRPATPSEIDAAIRSTFATPGTALQTSPAPPAFNYNPANGTLVR